MKAKFEHNDTREKLIQGIDEFICRVLELASDATMHEKSGFDGKIDRDDLLNLLEEFAGKDYIVSEKLKHDFVLDEDDCEYLRGLINEKNGVANQN